MTATTISYGRLLQIHFLYRYRNMIILISSVIITNNIIPYRIGTVNFCFIFICLAHIIFLLMIQFYVVFHLMLKPYVVWDRKQSVAINKNYIKTINAYIYAILYDENVDVLDFSYNVIPFLKSFLRQYFKIFIRYRNHGRWF